MDTEEEEIQLSDQKLQQELSPQPEEEIPPRPILFQVDNINRGHQSKAWLNYLRLPYSTKCAKPMTIQQAKQLDRSAYLERTQMEDQQRIGDTDWDPDSDPYAQFKVNQDMPEDAVSKPRTTIVVKLGVNDSKYKRMPPILGWEIPLKKIQWPFVQRCCNEKEKYRMMALEVMDTVSTLLKEDQFPFKPYWKRPGIEYAYTNVGFATRDYREQMAYHIRTEPTPFHFKPYSYKNDGTEYFIYLVTFDLIHAPGKTKISRSLASSLNKDFRDKHGATNGSVQPEPAQPVQRNQPNPEVNPEHRRVIYQVPEDNLDYIDPGFHEPDLPIYRFFPEIRRTDEPLPIHRRLGPRVFPVNLQPIQRPQPPAYQYGP